MMKTDELELTNEWDKTYERDGRADHERVTFANRYGITLAADLFKPKGAQGKLAAIAVAGPFGAVKEQVSGRYAQEMAARGFLTICFDPSFTGESGGTPRNVASPDINTEDFQAAVDYLSCRDDVNPEAIGIIGVCGWGGMALSAAAIDTRVKATVTSTMYDMARVNANGYYDEEDSEEARHVKRVSMNAQRSEDYRTGAYKLAGGLPTPDELGDDVPQFMKDYADFYKTELGYHPRSVGGNGGWNATGCISFLNQPLLCYVDEIRTPVLMIHGEKAHSLYFSKDAYAAMTKGNAYAGNKELMVIPGAVHTDLYYKFDVIPFDRIQTFFEKNLA